MKNEIDGHMYNVYSELQIKIRTEDDFQRMQNVHFLTN